MPKVKKKDEASGVPQSATPVKKPKKTAQANAEPKPAVDTVSAAKGQKPAADTTKAKPAPKQAAAAKAKAPAEAAAPAAKATTEPEATAPKAKATPKAPASAKKAKAATPATVEPQLEAAPTPAPAKATKAKAPAKPRSAKAPAKVAAATVGEALPEPTPTAAAEPVLLEIPIPAKQNKRQKKAKADAPLPGVPLPEVLAGVEAVPVEPETLIAEPLLVEPVIAETVAVPEKAAKPKPASKKVKATKKPAPTKPEPVQAAPAEVVAEVPAEIVEAPSASAEEQLLLSQLRKLGRPVHVRDLEKTFTRGALERLGGWRRLTDLLEVLVESGAVVRTRKKTYGLPEAMSLVRGRFQSSQSGYGFVIPDSGGEDYYVPEGKTMEAWNGDIVLVRMEGRGDNRNDRGGPRRGQKGDGNPRASVVRIVQRAYRQLVGTLEFSHGHPILRPDDHRARHRILLVPDGLEDLKAGARVVAELYWPENTGEDEVFGQVVRVLGAEDDPATETEAVIVKFKLHGDFPADVLAQADAISVDIPEEALRGRLDLRSFNIFTVDGRDAKDFDDAIHIQPTPEGTFVVGIHIADVSHYVREGTPLDHEAYARATSVYLPGRVLPMLPEHLSNGVCSLVPYQDRLTMTALVELSAEGDILKVQLVPSVINSKARLTYDEVQAYSEATATLPDNARHLEGDLHLLLKITTKLRQKRLREGSLDFKLREVKVDVGPDGRMELIPIREETARGMIEDLMLLANKVVAHYLLEREIPTLFRIHEEPTLQRFQEVSNAIGRMGLAFPGGEPTPQAYQAVLKQVRGTGRESVVNTLLLRSMQQAKYAGENLGHFGLAFDEYLHFTSPIRRYPDLVVHRTLKHVLGDGWKAGSRAVAEFQAKLPALGEHTSDRERAAAEAERDLTKYYQCKWAEEHLGESFVGNVSGVTASGLYVMLDNGVEGKLHISYLDDDYYAYLEDAQILKGRRTGKVFRLGDPVNVTISAVKPLARQIDLVLADPTNPEYKLGSTATSQENTTMDQTVKPRARRREEREAEHREKLAAIPVSAPKKFTLEDDSPAIQTSPQSAARAGGYTRQNGRTGRQNGARDNRSGSATFGGVSMNGRSQSSGQREGQPRSAGSGPRRVITLERPRNEHLRPVNITVQRMYFGDWTVDNMPADEGQSQARAGRERGYTRNERTERGGNSGGRGWTRGSSDRGAVQNPNGRAPQTAQPPAAAAAQDAPLALPALQSANSAAADDAKRRRRRRGRRTGSGNASSE